MCIVLKITEKTDMNSIHDQHDRLMTRPDKWIKSAGMTRPDGWLYSGEKPGHQTSRKSQMAADFFEDGRKKEPERKTQKNRKEFQKRACVFSKSRI